ncbi:hypothetical protein GCM10010221_51360 [Streptomyces parvus]|nr:hypothetical protein GCM10010221_51360 [Streptomyces parvus]
MQLADDAVEAQADAVSFGDRLGRWRVQKVGGRGGGDVVVPAWPGSAFDVAGPRA